MLLKSALALSVLTDHESALGFRIWQPGGAAMRHAHTHPDIELNFLSRGSMEYFMGGRFRKVSAGEVAIFWAGLPHQLRRKDRVIEGIWMTIPLQWMLRWKHAVRLKDLLLNADMVKYGIAEHEPLFRRWLSDFQTERPELREIIAGEMESHFSRLSLSLKGRKTPRATTAPISAAAGRIEEITRFLSEHYTEEIAVEDVAKALRMHPKYLLTLFRKTCHITLWEYVLRLRLAHAQRLLLTTERTVLDVALEAGFGSLSAFYQAFRKYIPHGTPSMRRLVEPRRKNKPHPRP